MTYSGMPISLLKQSSRLGASINRTVHACRFAKMSTEARTTELQSNYDRIKSTVPSNVTLVAVSKLKPSSDIQILYDYGHRHFGENYIQELITKSQELPSDIKWHFIGSLQSNKCKLLSSSVSNLFTVETIDSVKKANELNKGCAERKEKLNVYVQINTSGEEEKSGVEPDQAESLVKHIIDSCEKLHVDGLMTIGSLATSRQHGENRDFDALKRVKQDLESSLDISLKLSMGMSEDYQDAIKQGSDEVRVGSSIFGARPPKENRQAESEVAEEKK